MKTLMVPAELDGANMVRWLKGNGDAFTKGEPLVAFTLDDADRQLCADHDGVLARIMAHPPDDAVTFGTGAPLAIVTAPGEDIGYGADTFRSVRMLLRRTCNACGNDYPLNGLVQSKVCPSCKVTESASAHFWTSYVFEDAIESLIKGVSAGGNVLAGRHGACSIQCASVLPLCRKCFQLLEWPRLAPIWAAARSGSPGEIACTACGEVHAVREAPEWARTLQPGLLGALGEQGLEAAPAPVGKPVVFSCPQCAAPLKVDGSKRIVACEHCNVDVRLPDDLWSHFNPVSKWERWWLLFDPVVPDKLLDDDSEEASPPPRTAEPVASTEPTREQDPAPARPNPISVVLVIVVIAFAGLVIWQLSVN